MKKIDVFLNNLGRVNNFSLYFSFFRVIISLILIKQIFQIQPIISLMYGGQYYLKGPATIVELIRFESKPLQDNIHVYIYIYVFFLILHLFGIGKNYVTFVVFVMTDILQKLCPQVLNGGDNLLKFILLYMIFADSFQYLCFSPSKKVNNFYTTFFTNLAGLAICIHLCLIYLISGLHKTHSDVWFHGVATYYTFQLERFSGTNINTSLAHNTLFVVFSTYFTLLTELFYPVLVWFKSTKKIVITCMIMIHLGIYIFMMIYDFQLIFILAQGFFFTNRFWYPKYLFIKNKVFSRKPVII